MFNVFNAISSLASSAWSGGTNVDAAKNPLPGTGMRGLGGSLADNTYAMIAFGTVIGGVSAELSGGNFWQGALTGFVVSALNHAMHKIEDPNKQLAKKIAKEYGYDWKEVKAFLDKNPFELTHKGVAMAGKEALSSKNIEDGPSVIDFARDQIISEVQNRIIEFFSPKAGKIWGMVSELLSSQTAHAPNANYRVEQNQRVEAAKSTLIKYFFQKPSNYQTPSIHNNYRSATYHSSRFDLMHYRNY